MSGHLNGVAARIQKEFPSAIYVHCFAHCTNLVLQSTCRRCAPIRDALDLVMELSDILQREQHYLITFKASFLQLQQA